MARVLVVDDDPDIRVALAEALKIAGYDVASAATGTGALEVCRQQCPDLVLLDQMLPDIDGLEVCRRLRDEPALLDRLPRPRRLTRRRLELSGELVTS